MATFLCRFLRQPKHQQLDFVRRKGVFYGQVVRMTNSSVKRRGFPDKRGVGSPGQMRTVVSRADADWGLTDKRGLRFTDRRSSDFPDTCHLDFPDVSYLDFPDTRHLNFPYTHPPHKATKIRNYKLRPEKWSNLQTSWRLVVKNARTKVGTGHPHHIETEPVHGGFAHWKNGNHSAISWQGQVSVDVSSHVEQSRHNSASDTSLSA